MLEEKDAQTKLDMLFRKNLYDVAIKLARSHQYDPVLIVDIFRKFGDHLYAKGDYDQAMSKYVMTIGKLEPSYVIRKYLDAQRIRNLTDYLQVRASVCVSVIDVFENLCLSCVALLSPFL